MQVRKLGLRRNKEGGRSEGRVGYKEAPEIKIKKNILPIFNKKQDNSSSTTTTKRFKLLNPNICL